MTYKYVVEIFGTPGSLSGMTPAAWRLIEFLERTCPGSTRGEGVDEARKTLLEDYRITSINQFDSRNEIEVEFETEQDYLNFVLNQ